MHQLLTWFNRLLSAAIGGVANVILAVVVAPDYFLTRGWEPLAKMAVGGGLMSVAMFIQKEPFPVPGWNGVERRNRRKRSHLKNTAILIAILSLLGPGLVLALSAQFHQTVSATSSNTNVAIGFAAAKVVVLNNSSSASSAFVDVIDGVATTSDIEVKPGEVAEFGPGITNVGVIATSTATVRVDAVR